MVEYLLGVDGGNSKTHYALFDSCGNLVNFIKAGTASHEQVKDGYEGMKRELEMHIHELLDGSGLKTEDIGFGVFGLAGADTRQQHVEIGRRIEQIGLKRFKVYNDAFLGLKAGSESGFGICSNNGTGTTCVGIDRNGIRIQVGGLGVISGDDAGGGYISGEVIRLVYESIYRCGRQTVMKDILFRILDITCEDMLVDTLYEKVIPGFIHRDILSRVAFDAANLGDDLALELLRRSAAGSARSVTGVYERLDFSGEEALNIVMAGSIYVKGENPILIETFKSEVSRNIKRCLHFHLLKEPPAAGAVLWAFEELYGAEGRTVRKKILDSLCKI